MALIAQMDSLARSCGKQSPHRVCNPLQKIQPPLEVQSNQDLRPKHRRLTPIFTKKICFYIKSIKFRLTFYQISKLPRYGSDGAITRPWS